MGANIKKDDHILRGPAEIGEVPEVSLGTFLLHKLQSFGSKTALVNGVTGDTMTFAEILTKSLSVAETMRRRGVKPGDVIAICSENSLEYYLPAIGSHFVGASCAPLNPSYTTREMLHSMSISKPRIVFCSPNTAARIQEVCCQVDFLMDVVEIGATSFDNHTHFKEFLEYKYPEVTSYNGDRDAVAEILCSSGTSGLPKCVMLTDRNVLTSLHHMKDRRFAGVSPDEIYLSILPFSHTFGYNLMMTMLSLGVKTILLSRFEAQPFLNAIQTYKVSLLFLVPPLFVFLAKHPLVSQYDLTSIRNIWSGAAPLSFEVQTQVMERIGVKNIRQGYGMTETVMGLIVCPPDNLKFGSSGKLVPGTLCKVIDLISGEPAGPNISGELCFRGPEIMKGYRGDLEATLACCDKDGFLHTGDIGYYDEDGYFFIVDRLKELIKYKGFQVPPAELEALLLSHPLINDAAVIGIPDDDAGELPLAFIVLQPGQHVTKEEVMKFVAGQVSTPKRLHGGVRFVEVIPKSGSGKILRRELRDLVAQEAKS